MPSADALKELTYLRAAIYPGTGREPSVAVLGTAARFRPLAKLANRSRPLPPS